MHTGALPHLSLGISPSFPHGGLAQCPSYAPCFEAMLQPELSSLILSVNHLGQFRQMPMDREEITSPQ